MWIRAASACPIATTTSKDDAKSKETRERYLQHVQRVFELMGDSPDAAKKNAETVMRLETAMAKASLTRVERRDPHKLVHKMKMADLSQLAPNFDWLAYYREMQYPAIAILNVDAPEFIKELNTLLASEPIDNWKTYLRFHVADTSSPYLSSKFVEENFEFYREYLRGAKEMQPRWKRCVQYVDYDLGEALGQVYVAKVFSPELKAEHARYGAAHRGCHGRSASSALDWMSPETKQQALIKLAGIRNKIGYPDQVARLQLGEDCRATILPATSSARISSRAAARSTKSASRSTTANGTFPRPPWTPTTIRR